jgi:isoquinoline 1-oxidoreductase alpha subunit
MAVITFSVNGHSKSVDVDPDTPLLWVLRDHLGMTGTKFGCGLGVCGACTIHLDGQAQRACQIPISQVGAQKVTTIEGLSAKGDHPVQKAWIACDVAQCGYCQPGQIMAAVDLLKRHPKPTGAQIDEGMHENLCRCGTYQRIKQAIEMASGGGK